MFELLTLADAHGDGNAVAAALAACAGLLIGSFLNVVIHRLPVMMQRESDNYVAQRKRSRSCRTSDRYNLVDAALLLPVIAATRSRHRKHPGARATWPCVANARLQGSPFRSATPSLNCWAPCWRRGLAWHFGTGWAGLGALVFGYFLLLAMTFIDA
jgi:leader peptidase (prepilin peptidase)/N-methyltransferase